MSDLDEAKETFGEELEVEGLVDTAEGLDDLQMAAEADDLSKAAIAAGVAG